MDRLLLTPEDAAEVIGVGRTKLYELLRVGADGVTLAIAGYLPGVTRPCS